MHDVDTSGSREWVEGRRKMKMKRIWLQSVLKTCFTKITWWWFREGGGGQRVGVRGGGFSDVLGRRG